jgi:hypothetical protein
VDNFCRWEKVPDKDGTSEKKLQVKDKTECKSRNGISSTKESSKAVYQAITFNGLCVRCDRLFSKSDQLQIHQNVS